MKTSQAIRIVIPFIIALLASACSATSQDASTTSISDTATKTPIPPTATLAPPTFTPTPEPVNFMTVNEAITKVIEMDDVREYVLCYLQGAIWGSYDAEVQVGAAASFSETPYSFRIEDGQYVEEVLTENISDLATASREGVITVPDVETAFALGLPFFIADVRFETPTKLLYTLISNPNSTIDEAFTKEQTDKDGWLITLVGTNDPLASNPEPQHRSYEFNKPLVASENTFFSITTDGQGSCGISNEILLQEVLLNGSATISGTIIGPQGVTVAEIILKTYQDDACAELSEAAELSETEEKQLEECAYNLASVMSDAEGRYVFEGINPGWYRLTIHWNLEKRPDIIVPLEFTDDFMIGYLESDSTPKTYSAFAVQRDNFQVVAGEHVEMGFIYGE